MSREKFYKEQIELEKQIISAAEHSIAEVKNPLIKNLIVAISIDSQKHAKLLDSLVSMTSEPTPFIDESQNEQLARYIQAHIDLEAQAIETYKKLLELLEDEKEKLIIQAIYRDEVRHHHLLKKIHEVIVKSETLSEEEIRDWLWEDAVSHGSPGG